MSVEGIGWNSACSVQSLRSRPARLRCCGRPVVRKLLPESPSATSHSRLLRDTPQDRTTVHEPSPDPPVADGGRSRRSPAARAAERACHTQKDGGSFSQPLLVRWKTRQELLQIAVSVPVVTHIFSHVFVFGENSQVIIKKGRDITFLELPASLKVGHELKEI